MSVLSQKIALIFGGSGGIGFETAKAFAQEGATVVLSSHREENDSKAVDQLLEMGYRAAYVTGDITDPAFIEEAFAFTIDTFGLPDITVNAAGVGGCNQSLGSTDYEVMNMMMKINVVSPYIVMQKAIDLLQKADRAGKIINLGSFRSHHTGTDGNIAPYAASKAAIGSLTESTQRTLHKAGNRIAVSLVCPGAANTEMNIGTDGPPNPSFMHPQTVAQCILCAAMMPDNATVSDITMLCTEQNPW